MSAIIEQKFRFWRENPVQFVRDVFGVEPDLWQKDALNSFVVNQRLAFKASKGVGKSCCLAWMIWNFLLTRPMPKIAVTSISADNLADGLWAELAMWQNKSPLLKELFVWTKTRIYAKASPEAWFCSARTWSQSADVSTIGNTLAGLHADYIMFVMDESGAMPEAIMASAEAALSSCVEGRIIQAGNPNQLDGVLYNACTKGRHLWWVVEISSDPENPKRSPRVSVEWAQSQIDLYGRDNDWVRVNVLGEFPKASLNALIGYDEVREAQLRYYRPQEYSKAARILSVDVARMGSDQSVIAFRQGLYMAPFKKYRNIDGTAGASLVAREWNEREADACFIDDTGGFGGSWIDNLIRIGYNPIGVHYSGKASNPRYYNKRTEMMFEFVEWIKRGGALPESPELLAALTKTTYGHKGDALLLEPKDMVKAKLGYSPDECDSAMGTFANPVMRSDGNLPTFVGFKTHKSEFDPFAMYKKR